MRSRAPHRRLAAVALAVATVLGVASVQTGAVYIDSAPVTGNMFSSGTVDLAADQSTLFTVSGLTPGDRVTAPLTLTNSGTATLRYAMRSTTSEDTLASALELTVQTRSAADSSCAAFDGTLLYTGILGSTAGTNIVGDPSTGAQPFDRALGPGQADDWCVRVALPVTATNSTASLSTTATFTFSAEQTANNGRIYAAPVLTGTTTALNPDGTTVSPVLTVPAGVSATDLGVIVVGTDDSNPIVPSAPGWTARAINPSGYNNMSWSVLTRLGGLKAGDTLTLTLSGPNDIENVLAAWFNTGGRDVVVTGTPTTRNGVSQAFTTLPGITTTQPGMDVLVVASERTLSDGTTISSWAPSDVTASYFVEEPTYTDVSHFLGYLAGPDTPGPTGSRTVTYSHTSGNGAGILLGLGLPGVN